MKIFEVRNSQPEITSETLLIPEFKALWDRDKTKDKSQAFREFRYIYFMMDYKSLYNAYSGDAKEYSIISDYMGSTEWKPDELIKVACRKYEILQTTPTMNFLKSAQKATQDLMSYFNSIDWNERTVTGQPVYKLKEVTSALKDCAGIVNSLASLEEKVAKELSTSTKVRGGGEMGFFELG